MRCRGICSRALLTVTLALLGACGRDPLVTNTGGAGLAAEGGATDIPTGGSAGNPNGGAAGTAANGSGGYASGGIAGSSSGGATVPALGGAAGAASGGAAGGTRASAGGAGMAKGGAAGGRSSSGGTLASGGSGVVVSCTGVVCAPIPSTCKKLIQEPGACCPTCTDTGCSSCPALTCPDGMVQQIAAGDCCPTCVVGPASLCASGQKSYGSLRQQLFDKYGSAGCKNSTDCTLVLESNACAFVCNVPLPTTMASQFGPNLNSSAAAYCATCSPPAAVSCEFMFSACVNGKCVALPAGVP